LPSVLWRCWLGGRKGIRPVKNWVVGCWRGCLGWGTYLHIAQQMPLPLTVSCSNKSRLVLTFLVLPFWYLLTWVVPDIFQKSSKTVVCVCVYCVLDSTFAFTIKSWVKCNSHMTHRPTLSSNLKEKLNFTCKIGMCTFMCTFRAVTSSLLHNKQVLNCSAATVTAIMINTVTAAVCLAVIPSTYQTLRRLILAVII